MAGRIPAIHVLFAAQFKGVDPRDKPGGDDRKCSVPQDYLIACGLIGLPVAPVMISGGPEKKNS